MLRGQKNRLEVLSPEVIVFAEYYVNKINVMIVFS